MTTLNCDLVDIIRNQEDILPAKVAFGIPKKSVIAESPDHAQSKDAVPTMRRFALILLRCGSQPFTLQTAPQRLRRNINMDRCIKSRF